MNTHLDKRPDTRVRAGRSRMTCALICVIGLSAVAARPARATILLFDQERDAATQKIVGPTSSGGMLPADYGDNVMGDVMAVPGGSFTYGNGGEGFTPNVTLNIYAGSATSTDSHVGLWQTGYGDLVNVIFADGPGTAGSPTLSVLFTASPGYAVDLYGFELGGWNNADYTIAAVQVFAGSATLFSATDVAVEGNMADPRHSTFAFDSPLSAPELLLQLDLSNLASGVQDNIGLDSIRFGQTPPAAIPEPGSATLFLCGLVLAVALPWRWRRRPR
ncbi:MAG: hypothetical protein ACYC4U_15065 [Pirellulaceae bacterium]